MVKLERLRATSVEKSDGTGFLKGDVVNITVDFDGDMKNNIVGFYASSYTNADGSSR
jgi:hypothetical protein